jgi:hypothetical protein
LLVSSLLLPRLPHRGFLQISIFSFSTSTTSPVRNLCPVICYSLLYNLIYALQQWFSTYGSRPKIGSRRKS